MEKPFSFNSLGDVASQLEVPVHRVEYVIRTRRIRPLIRAGGRKLYSDATVQRIASEIQRIDEERGGHHA